MNSPPPKPFKANGQILYYDQYLYTNIVPNSDWMSTQYRLSLLPEAALRHNEIRESHTNFDDRIAIEAYAFRLTGQSREDVSMLSQACAKIAGTHPNNRTECITAEKPNVRRRRSR